LILLRQVLVRQKISKMIKNVIKNSKKDLYKEEYLHNEEFHFFVNSIKEILTNNKIKTNSSS